MKLTPYVLLNAYSQGIFPMADDKDGKIYWFDPEPRAILPLTNFHPPRRLVRRIRQGGFEVRFDTSFRAVITACSQPAPARETTWISPEMIEAYCELQELGFAHSVETWMDDQLAGGLYGVTLGGLFAGESMFSRRTDASKIALVHLVERLLQQGFTLLDVQFMTDHLRRFGAIEIPRSEYKALLAQALTNWAKF
jgi:leucyl/phenylalanyl-tRNA--protein transferase